MTSYGNFYNATRSTSETSLIELATPPDWEGDTEALESAAHTKLVELLAGTGISLHGDEFYGPAYPSAAEQAAQSALIARKGETQNLWQDDDEDLTPQRVAVALLAEDEDWWLSVFDRLDGGAR